LPNLSQHIPIYLEQFPSYSNFKCKKIAVFTYRSPHFCWRRPCAYHAKDCMDGKTIRCLSNPLQHVPIYFQQFPSYSSRKSKKSQFSRTAAHIFVSPGDTPAIITQYVAWMERQFNACHTPRSMYPSIFNSFQVIRTASAKKSPFSRTVAHIFVSPGDAPGAITLNVIKVWGRGQKLVSQHVPIYFQQFPSYSSRKFKKYRSPHFCFPWRHPFDYHAICCMDGKTMQCLPNPSQHVPIYLQ